MSGPVCLTVCIILGGAFLYARLAAPEDTGPVSLDRTASADQTAPRKTPFGELAPIAAANPYGELLDPAYSLGAAPVTMAQSFPLRSGFQSMPSELRATISETESVVPVPMPTAPQLFANVPVPMPRPAELLASSEKAPLPPGRPASLQAKAGGPVSETADNRSFFEKLFGKSDGNKALAYANAEDGAVRGSPIGRSPIVSSLPSSTVPYDRQTAVYDISRRVVYMPNGTKLEAHSGLGERLDDPRYVNERMRGATPPHLYELTLRESLFHGVQALRLNPIGEGQLYGRTGLLAHRYMLGPNGDSNGCVSFKDYDAFLQAFRNGEVKRLAVVARLD